MVKIGVLCAYNTIFRNQYYIFNFRGGDRGPILPSGFAPDTHFSSKLDISIVVSTRPVNL